MSKCENIKKLQYTKTKQNMTCKILDDHGNVNTTLFLQYLGGKTEVQEYFLEWNKNFKIDPCLENLHHHDEEALPIRVIDDKAQIEKAKREINPL